MNKQTKAFIAHVKAECKKHGVRLKLGKGCHIKVVSGPDGVGSTLCNGYFDQDEKVLAVATGQPFDNWFRILVHEYGHMTQWVDQCRYWSEKHLVGCADVFNWIEGKIDLKYAQYRSASLLNMAIELDCERRSVELIKKFDLPINTVEYTKQANSYVLFYHLIIKRKAFYKPGFEPYNVKSVWSKMPKHFNMDYRNPPKRLLKILDTLPR